MEDRPFSSIIRELGSGVQGLVSSEIHLAKSEVVHNLKDMAKQSGMAIVFATVAYLGVLALLAFLIIGLGRLFGERYWLSALIVGLLLGVPGVVLTIRSLQRIGYDATLPVARNNIQDDQSLLNRKLQQISEQARKRAL